MILRTPPLKKQRATQGSSPGPGECPDSNQRMVIYEDSLPELSHQPEQEPSEHMLCTYQCRQMVKSDFFEALETAEKQVRDYQSKLESLNDSFIQSETERKDLREQLLYAEQELAATKGREQALQEQLFNEVNDSQERIKKQLQLHNELELKLQNEILQRHNAESSAASAEEKASLSEGNLRHLSESSEKEKKKLHYELAQLKKDSKFSVSKINADIERMEFRAKSAEEESELLKEQLGELEKQLIECLNQKSEAENKLLSLTSQESTSTTDASILVKHLQEELRNYESEVREARKLKSSHESIEVLKEKLLEEKRRGDRAEAELLRIPQIETSMKKLEDELTSWKLILDQIPEVSCSSDIPLKFASLQKEVIDSMMKVGEANGRLKQMEVGLDAAELTKKKLETEAVLAKEKSEVSKSEVKRNELMLSMLAEERDQLKSTVNQLKKQKNVEEDHDPANKTLAQELESSLLKKECFIKELERNLYEQQEVNNRQHNEITMLHERLNSEARRLKSLERESDRLRSEISLLESKLGHGDFSAANTKVLRMVNTLTVENEAKQTIEALRTELQKTKDKLIAFEDLKKQSADSGKSMDSYISGKLVQYKEQIATLEKREERYRTVFADRISVFRRACCELFGYKIVMEEHQRPNGIPITHFTLQSIYAQGDDEKLEFEYESGNTNIIANDYTSQREISQQVEIFVRKMNSIPAFTANLTIESFNKRTLS